MNSILFETSRLQLRNISIEELESFLNYRNEPETAKYQSWSPNLDREYGIEFINSLKDTKFGELDKWTQTVWLLKTDGTHIGDCAVHILDDGKQAEIGFTLSQKYQNQGYATEAVSAMIDFLFRTLELHRIIAITDVKNFSSIKLLERLGMRKEAHFIENIWFKGAWGDEYNYAILAREWFYLHSTALFYQL